MHTSTAAARTPASPATPLATVYKHYRWYVLALLWCVALLRFVDMQILAVLLEPIRAEFLLSDTELALLGGLAFALFYGLLGLPVAWLADRCDRRAIVAAAVTLWSLMTAVRFRRQLHDSVPRAYRRRYRRSRRVPAEHLPACRLFPTTATRPRLRHPRVCHSRRGVRRVPR